MLDGLIRWVVWCVLLCLGVVFCYFVDLGIVLVLC